jgi:hypothetical protein
MVEKKESSGLLYRAWAVCNASKTGDEEIHMKPVLAPTSSCQLGLTTATGGKTDPTTDRLPMPDEEEVKESFPGGCELRDVFMSQKEGGEDDD